MSNLISLEKKLEDWIEQGRLYVECLGTVRDDEGVYALKGKCYEVVNISKLNFLIEGEGGATLRFRRDDNCFELFVVR